MTLQEALKVNGRAVRKGHYDGVLAFADGKLYIEFSDGKGCPAAMSFEDSMKDDFLPFKEPCKHEPIEYDLNLIAEAGHYDPKLGAYDLKRTTQSKSFVFGSECKHCGVKLRAEKWVECETKILA